jgi:hypothetical protein
VPAMIAGASFMARCATGRDDLSTEAVCE